MKSIFSGRFSWISTTAGVVVGVFAVVALVQAATTISTNISTAGTLSVTGLSSLTTASTSGATTHAGNLWVGGNATTTATTGAFATQGAVTLASTLSVTGLTSLTTASTSGATTHAGNLWVGGNATTTASTGAIATQGSLTVGSAGIAVSGIIFGYCVFPTVTITASSTAMVSCVPSSGSTGIASGDRIFVMATSSLANNFIVQHASSSATNVIQIDIFNAGYDNAVGQGASRATGQNSVNFWAAR